MLIHSQSKWSLCLSNVLEATLRAVDEIYQIAEFAVNVLSRWDVIALVFFLGKETGYTVLFGDFGAVSAFTKSGTDR